jgi:hypothetical protein
LHVAWYYPCVSATCMGQATDTGLCAVNSLKLDPLLSLT